MKISQRPLSYIINSFCLFWVFFVAFFRFDFVEYTIDFSLAFKAFKAMLNLMKVENIHTA